MDGLTRLGRLIYPASAIVYLLLSALRSGGELTAIFGAAFLLVFADLEVLLHIEV